MNGEGERQSCHAAQPDEGSALGHACADGMGVGGRARAGIHPPPGLVPSPEGEADEGRPSDAGGRRQGGAPSVAQAVRDALARDPAAQEALSRGLVNLRALARQLIHREGWRVSEEAVLSALRRHPRAFPRGEPPRGAPLAGALLRLQSGLCAFELPRTIRARSRVAALVNTLAEAGVGAAAVEESGHGLRILLDARQRGLARRLLAGEGVVAGGADLGLFTIALPRPRSAAAPFAVALQALSLAGIQVRGAILGYSEGSLIVDGEAEAGAYAVLRGLTGPGRGSASGPGDYFRSPPGKEEAGGPPSGAIR